MSTLTDGVTTVTPILVTGWASERPSRNIVHELIGGTGVAYTLRPAGPSTGTLGLLFGSLAEAHSAEALASRGAVLTLTVDDDGREALSLAFVASGRIGLELDDETRDRWVLALDFTEVAA